MTVWQEIITIGLCVFGTMLTRFTPFIVFKSNKPTPSYVQYLGKALPSSIFGMLVIYCLKDVSLFAGNHGIPEAFAIIFVIAIHLWKRKMLLSIAGGTIIYMLMVQMIFK